MWPDERSQLRSKTHGGDSKVRCIKRSQILLAADAGATDEDIARDVGVGTSTIYRTRRRFVEEGAESALSEDPRPGATRKLSVNDEALLIATACSTPPEGRAQWTCELLAEQMVVITEHASLSRETIRRRLTALELKPWQKKMWCIPKVDAEYVARMEDVLELYAEPAESRGRAPVVLVLVLDPQPPLAAADNGRMFDHEKLDASPPRHSTSRPGRESLPPTAARGTLALDLPPF